MDGPTGTVRGNHLKSNGGALADGADANIGCRSGQRNITTSPGPGGHKRGRAPRRCSAACEAAAAVSKDLRSRRHVGGSNGVTAVGVRRYPMARAVRNG